MLDLPELKIVKPSDTRWLAHAHAVRRQSKPLTLQFIIVNALNIYEQTHAPEALDISRVLRKPSTVSATYLLEYVIPAEQSSPGRENRPNSYHPSG